MWRFIPILFLSAVLCWTCSSDHEELIGDQTGEIFYATVGQTISMSSGIHIQWTGVSDNRCPISVQCPVAGVGRMRLVRLNSNDTIQSLRHQGLCVADTLDCGNQIIIGTDTLDLLYLYPYPDTLPYPEQSQYEAKLIIRE